VLYPVTKERGACPHFQVVDVAVQGLVHSEDELRHVLKPPHKFHAASKIAQDGFPRLDRLHDITNFPNAGLDASSHRRGHTMRAADFHEVGRRGIRLVPSIGWDERIADVKSESFQTDPLPENGPSNELVLTGNVFLSSLLSLTQTKPFP
jgi:hypothetical protein